MADKDTEIRFHQEPNWLHFVDVSGKSLFTMPYVSTEKQGQMGKELQAVVDQYAAEI